MVKEMTQYLEEFLRKIYRGFLCFLFPLIKPVRLFFSGGWLHCTIIVAILTSSCFLNYVALTNFQTTRQIILDELQKFEVLIRYDFRGARNQVVTQVNKEFRELSEMKKTISGETAPGIRETEEDSIDKNTKNISDQRKVNLDLENQIKLFNTSAVIETIETSKPESMLTRKNQFLDEVVKAKTADDLEMIYYTKIGNLAGELTPPDIQLDIDILKSAQTRLSKYRADYLSKFKLKEPVDEIDKSNLDAWTAAVVRVDAILGSSITKLTNIQSNISTAKKNGYEFLQTLPPRGLRFHWGVLPLAVISVLLDLQLLALIYLYRRMVFRQKRTEYLMQQKEPMDPGFVEAEKPFESI